MYNTCRPTIRDTCKIKCNTQNKHSINDGDDDGDDDDDDVSTTRPGWPINRTQTVKHITNG